MVVIINSKHEPLNLILGEEVVSRRKSSLLTLRRVKLAYVTVTNR
jgi:hypothetical protein